MAAQEGSPKQIVFVAGERVALTPTGLLPSDPIGVDFDTYYIPETMSPSDVTLVKATFQELFGGTSLPIFDTELQKDLEKRTSQAFLPPCDPSQKELVLQSLEFRLRKLRQELSTKGVLSAKDLSEKLAKTDSIVSADPRNTTTLRDMIRHFQTLKALIENYNTNQQCVSMSDKAFGNLQFDLTDDRAKELLRQFVFFTLQAHHPLQDYKKTNPTAPQFIKRLEINPLGEPKFGSFLTTYKDNKLPIPESIARVLDSVDAKSGVLDGEVKRRLAEAIQSEKDKLLKYLYTLLPESHPFWRTLGKDRDIYRILDRLVEFFKDADGQVVRLTAENESLKEKLKRCEQNKALLDENYARIVAQVEDLQRKLGIEGAKDKTIAELQSALQKAKADHDARVAELTAQLEDYARQIEANRARIEALESANTALTLQVQSLQAEVDRLRGIEESSAAQLQALRAQHAEALANEQARTAAETTAKEEAQGQRTQALAELEAARTEVRGNQATIAAQGEQITSLTEQVTTLTREKRDCDTLTERLQSEIRTKDAELVTLRAEKANFESQLAAAREEIRRLTEEAEEDREAAEEEKRALQETIRNLQAQFEDCEAKRKACEKALEELKAKASEPEQRAAAIAGELEQARAQLAAAEAERARLQEENRRLQEDISNKDAALKRSGEELAGMKQRAEDAEGRVGTMEGQVGTLRGQVGTLEEQLGTRTGELTAEKEKAQATAAAHVVAIDGLTRDFQAQVQAKVVELGAEKKRADETRAELLEEREKLEKQTDAYLKLQAAIEAVITGPETTVNQSIAALEGEGNEQTKETLALIYRKLQDLESLAAEKAAMPMSHAEETTQKKLSQCYNVFLLTYLWQTNFPVEDAQTEAFLGKVNGIFSGRPTVTGVYKTSPTGTILEYLNLVIKLLTLYDGETSSVELSEKEKNYFNLIVTVLPKLRDSGKSLVDEARDYFTSHQPKAPLQEANLLLRGASVVQDPSGQLNFPLLYYCFLVVMRDYLNTITGSLGRCPLPKILQGLSQRRGSALSTLD
jgi:hypothetical protein